MKLHATVELQDESQQCTVPWHFEQVASLLRLQTLGRSCLGPATWTGRLAIGGKISAGHRHINSTSDVTSRRPSLHEQHSTLNTRQSDTVLWRLMFPTFTQSF